jgi:hypothetical protein
LIGVAAYFIIKRRYGNQFSILNYIKEIINKRRQRSNKTAPLVEEPFSDKEIEKRDLNINTSVSVDDSIDVEKK